MTLGNTRLYGGVAMLTHLASAVDGELDAVIFRGWAAQALATTPLALRSLHANAPGVSYHRFRRLIIEGGPTLESQLDGEVGPQEARVVEVEPWALRVLVPDAGQAIFGAAGGLGWIPLALNAGEGGPPLPAASPPARRGGEGIRRGEMIAELGNCGGRCRGARGGLSPARG